MYDIDDELNKIVEKYDLIYSENIIDNMVQNFLFESIAKNSSIAFWGAGDHTKEIITLLENKFPIVGIFDKYVEQCRTFDEKKIQMDNADIKIEHTSNIANYKFTVIIISFLVFAYYTYLF